MDSHVDNRIAGPSTLLGQLQRGLGRGYLAAVRADAGRDELLTCIVHDPRWDRQIEERASYYGRLAVELEVTAEPIAAALRRGEPSGGIGGLPADVLAEMAVRGRGDALDALRGELHHAAWRPALEALQRAEDEHGEPLLRHEDLVVIAARDPDELRRASSDAALPWRKWAAVEPKLRALLGPPAPGEEPAPRAAAPKPQTSMSTSELLSIAEPRNGIKVARVLAQRRDSASVAALSAAARSDDRNRRLAGFRALGAQGNSTLLEHVAEFLKTDPAGPSYSARRSTMIQYLDALPADLVLPRARAWLGQAGGVAIAAQRVLARHARPDDRGLVEETLAAALDQGAVYRACSMVEALTAIADPRSAELLASVFERIPYSWARPRVLEALEASGSTTATLLAAEALWDCDAEARELGARMTVLDESSRERLTEMADDRYERDHVRAAARARLCGATEAPSA